MAKTGFWLRGAKGKLAGTTIYRGKGGATIQREINSQPTNPRSQAQMTQRASFADVAKFYKHAAQNLFKFAFESKKATESDYNAFVRLNVGKAVVINKLQQDNVNFPAIGDNWQLSEGSLPECPVVARNSQGSYGILSTSFGFSVPSIKSTDTTIGQLSTALMTDYNLQLNDIVTIVEVLSEVRSINATPSTAPEWSVLQFRVNPEDTTLMSEYKLGILSTYPGEVAWNVSAQGFAQLMTSVGGFSVIFSRVQQGQPLKVSNAFLHNSATANALLTNTLSDSYRASALTSWGTADKAILQGSLSREFEPEPLPEDITVGTLTLNNSTPKTSSNFTDVVPEGANWESAKLNIIDGSQAKTLLWLNSTKFSYTFQLSSRKMALVRMPGMGPGFSVVKGDIYIDDVAESDSVQLVSLEIDGVTYDFTTAE